MNFVALALFILACGWNLYRDYQPTRANALRNEGHPQYFGAALAAGYIFLLAICLHHTASKSDSYLHGLTSLAAFSPRSEDAKPKPEEKKVAPTRPSLSIGTVNLNGGSATWDLHAPPSGNEPSPAIIKSLPAKPDDFVNTFAIAIWSAILAFLAPRILNTPFVLNRRVSLLTGYSALEEIERFAVDAVDRGVAVALTLTNGKFYVGVPIETSQDGSADTKWLQIQPLASGKREEDGTISFTTAYRDVYDRLDADQNETRSSSDFRIGLPVEHIVSIQYFDLDLYTQRFAINTESSDPELSAALKQVFEDEQHSGAAGAEAPGQIPWWCKEGEAERSNQACLQGETPEIQPAAAANSRDRRQFPDVVFNALKWLVLAGFTGLILLLPVATWMAVLSAVLAAIAAALLSVLPMGKWEKDWWGYA